MQQFFNIEALVRNTPDILYETKNFFQGADIFHRFSAIGGGALLASPMQINSNGHKCSAKGLTLGISHQRPDELHEKHINYLKQMGVEYLEITNHSPYSGMLLCTRTFAEMPGPCGKGEDLVQANHEFGSRGHIYQVHFRKVNGTLPDFHETFPDDGYLNMYKIMKALIQAVDTEHPQLS